VCVSGTDAGLDVAALMIDDADADEVLVVSVDLALSSGDRDRGDAILVAGPPGRQRHETPSKTRGRKR
jgi:3-oxoacyl-[acyl-carrier-protein] synthase III